MRNILENSKMNKTNQLSEEQEGISAAQIAFFSNHIKDIPTIILKDILNDIVYEIKDRENEEKE